MTFKLETNEEILEEKMETSLKKNHSDLVIGNILEKRYDEVTLKTKTETMRIEKVKTKIEKEIVDQVVYLHDEFIKVDN